MICAFSALKKGLKMTDFFYSTHFLRFQKQNEHRTATGGLISLGIIIVIIVGFAKMIADTFSLSAITYTTQIQKESVPSQTILSNDPEKYSMFAIQIQNIFRQQYNLSSPQRYFSLIVSYTTIKEDVLVRYENIEMQGCTREHWKSIESFIQKFDKLGISNWLCPKIGQNISLQGKYNSKIGLSSSLTIGAVPCIEGIETIDSNQTCATSQEVNEFFSLNSEILYGRVFYINTIINPNQQNYLSYYVQDMQFSFNRAVGSEMYLEFSSYSIETDYSIWPFSNIKKDSGYLTQNGLLRQPFFRLRDHSKYFSFSFVKSNDKIHYFREVQKISQVFSYIGGLIGAIIAFLFIINSFTNYSYEVVLASSIFSTNKQVKGQQNIQIKEREKLQSVPSPNIFQFIKSGVYDLLTTIKKSPNWPDSERISAYRQEILSHLNVRSILNRLIFIEFCLQHLFESYELYQLQLAMQRSPSKIKQIREKMDGDQIFEQQADSSSNQLKDYSNKGQDGKGSNFFNSKSAFDSKRNLFCNQLGEYKITVLNPDNKTNINHPSVASIMFDQQPADDKNDPWLGEIGKNLEERKSFKLLKTQYEKGDKKSLRIIKTVIKHNKQMEREKSKFGQRLECKMGVKKSQFNQQCSDFSQIPVTMFEKPRKNLEGIQMKHIIGKQ